MEESNRKFLGIWIPKEIWLSDKLTMQEKIFFVEIQSLDNEQGCFAANRYFADFFNISISRASQVIGQLVKKGFIISKNIKFKQVDGSYKEKRILKVKHNNPLENLKTPFRKPKETLEKTSIPPLENATHNNTISNTINNTKEREEKTPSPIREKVKAIYEEAIGLYGSVKFRKYKYRSFRDMDEIKKLISYLNTNERIGELDNLKTRLLNFLNCEQDWITNNAPEYQLYFFFKHWDKFEKPPEDYATKKEESYQTAEEEAFMRRLHAQGIIR